MWRTRWKPARGWSAKRGAAMVKIEGAAPHVLDAIAALTARAIPVCAHLGLTPQSVHKFGGFRIQGREQAAADRVLAEALAVQAAGADLLVMEGVPVGAGPAGDRGAAHPGRSASAPARIATARCW